MADDTIWNFVNDFLNGDIPRSVFWEYAKLNIQPIKSVFTVFVHWTVWYIKEVNW